MILLYFSKTRLLRPKRMNNNASLIIWTESTFWARHLDNPRTSPSLLNGASIPRTEWNISKLCTDRSRVFTHKCFGRQCRMIFLRRLWNDSKIQRLRLWDWKWIVFKVDERENQIARTSPSLQPSSRHCCGIFFFVSRNCIHGRTSQEKRRARLHSVESQSSLDRGKTTNERHSDQCNVLRRKWRWISQECACFGSSVCTNRKESRNARGISHANWYLESWRDESYGTRQVRTRALSKNFARTTIWTRRDL